MATVETIVAPAVEPITLAEAKEHLRRDGDVEDDLITSYIVAAREHVETFCRLRLITQRVRLRMDCFPAAITLPVWPVQSIHQVTYVDSAGAEQTLASTEYTLVQGRKPRIVVPAYQKVWPTTQAHFNAVAVDVVCGFGDAASAVPEELRLCIKTLVGDFDVHRTATGDKGPRAMNPLVDSVLRRHVFWI